MQILYVAPSYPPSIGGAQIHLHALAKAIRSLGNGVSVISHWSDVRTDWLRGTTVLSGPAKQYEYEGVSVSRLGFSFWTRAAMLPWVLAYYLLMEPSVRKISGHMLPYFVEAAGAPSLVHATRIGREFIIRAALDFAHRRNTPFVLTPVHHPGWRGYLYREYDKIYREADAILALTTAEKDTLVREKGVAEQRIHVTGIGPVLSERYSAEAFKDRYGLKERFVLFLGQQYKYKGVNAILQAAPIVWKKHPDVKFVFIGPHMPDSGNLFRKLRDTRVVNLGAVDLETKTSALAACEFLCMPSTQESFGGAYVEAWSLRKAVIGGRIDPIACVIDHGRDGLLSSQNPDELAEAISYLLSHPGDCRAMGDVGWQKVQDKYSWDRLAKKTLDVYRELSS
jgi:glycosyltransferase involved in cell wall biosynthesis